jgi:uncharacterized protein YwbE
MDDLLAQQPGPVPVSGPGGPAGPAAGHGSRLTRRRRVLLGVGVGAALLSVGGLIGAAFVKSPAQLAADTAAPPSTVTTAKVTSQDLTSSVAMRGVVYPSTQYDVSASGSAAQLYISKLDVRAGSTVVNGEVLAEIDGAPMFVLTGSVPAWRDLAAGDTGPDVAELQAALAALGYGDGGDTAGSFGVGTQDAVTAFYAHIGYPVPTAAGQSAGGQSAGAAGGPQVPQGDVVFLPSLPSTVIAVDGVVGQQAGSPFLTLSARGELALTGELPPAYASQLKTGLKVKVQDQATGLSATGTVAAVGTATQTLPTGTTVNIGGSGSPGSSGSSGSSGNSGSSGQSAGSGGSSGSSLFVPVTVRPSAPLPAALNGQNVLVTVLTGQTEGAVLTVPVAAIVTTAAGDSFVTVVAAGGRQTRVPVTPGMSDNGYVQVTAVSAGTLTAGDNVVVSG